MSETGEAECGMRNYHVRENHTTRRVTRITCVIVLAVAFSVTPPLWAQADRVTPPAVPANIQVPAGSKAFLAAHAVGTQDYICLPTGTGFAWTFFAPQPRLGPSSTALCAKVLRTEVRIGESTPLIT